MITPELPCRSHPAKGGRPPWILIPAPVIEITQKTSVYAAPSTDEPPSFTPDPPADPMLEPTNEKTTFDGPLPTQDPPSFTDTPDSESPAMQSEASEQPPTTIASTNDEPSTSNAELETHPTNNPEHLPPHAETGPSSNVPGPTSQKEDDVQASSLPVHTVATIDEIPIRVNPSKLVIGTQTINPLAAPSTTTPQSQKDEYKTGDGALTTVVTLSKHEFTVNPSQVIAATTTFNYQLAPTPQSLHASTSVKNDENNSPSSTTGDENQSGASQASTTLAQTPGIGDGPSGSTNDTPTATSGGTNTKTSTAQDASSSEGAGLSLLKRGTRVLDVLLTSLMASCVLIVI